MPPLPRGWLRVVEAARHAEAIKAILDTPPIAPRDDGLVLFAEIGSAQLLPCLVAIKSLHARLGRGRVALLDDGTLIGSDRAVLAQHCGDPEIIVAPGSDDTGLSDLPGWRALATVLERRSSEYWLWLSGDGVTLGPVPEVERAVALNASFLMPQDQVPGEPIPLADFCRATYPDGPVDSEIAARLESRLGGIERPGWRYLRSDSGLMGFAAGGPGLRSAAACRADLEQLVAPEDLCDADAARVAASLLLASENRTVILPHNRYGHASTASWDIGTSFLHFSDDARHADARYAEASQTAIAALLSQ
ncbi:hypothetical protein D2V17_09715 [Aurantiacibacter xanthus]|uniref:Uncharacterized protein n=2 Tax=Aurantiacibacter xanthus TaxID=1784712 RepID=A0A3A1P3W3_9SPHN|nr:hypothetical protein D2V17_09715 [Aurantiacibacter xanthus]